MTAYISYRFAHVAPYFHGQYWKRWMEMETLTTSSEHRTHDAAPATTDSTPPHGQYRGGAAVSNAGDVAMQWWGIGKTLALLSKQHHQRSCDHCYPGLCTVVRGYCSTAALQARLLQVTWVSLGCSLTAGAAAEP